ncbi:hypothetical protein BDZ89DRAFT_257747 [Hymenopellis radicata]|nr:hypothetical protein BDZ89DRAFT_257747 [Hymenopellis radicata]
MDQSPPTPLGASSAPLEILQHIFTLDAESYGGFCFRPGAKHPALRLAHVSRAWRAAALGTSVLWSLLEANINPNFRKVCANGSAWQWRSALDQFLVLAQDFPLHILLACSGMPRWRTDEEIQAIVAALLHTAPRWKSLSLWLRMDSDEEDGDWSFLDPLHDRLDSLEKLHVIVSCHDIPFSLSRSTRLSRCPKTCEHLNGERHSGRAAMVASPPCGFHFQSNCFGRRGRPVCSDYAGLSCWTAESRSTENFKLSRMV